MNENQKKDVKSYYKLLEQEFTELRAISFKSGSIVEERTEVDNFKDFLSFCDKWDGKANIYAGVHERSKGGTKGIEVKAIRIIALDIDSKRPKDEAATEAEMDKCKKFTMDFINNYSKMYGRPTVIMSGNGYQLLWKIRPILIDNNNRTQIERKIHNWIANIMDKHNICEDVKIDQIGDLARILKVAGTTSIKGNGTVERPFRVSNIVEFNDKLSDELRDSILMTEIENKQIVEVTTRSSSSSIGKFDNLLNKDGKLNDLYNGNTGGYISRSEAEMALLCKLVYYEFSDLEIDMIMNNSGIGKWRTSVNAYKELSLSKAKNLIVAQKEQKDVKRSKKITIDDVHNVFKKWLFLNDVDRIDVVLAVALSQKAQGPPLWIIFVGPSGDAKTEIVKALEGLSYTYKVLQLTENTLVSGMRELSMDLAPKLNNKIMLITDFASILSLKSEKQREVWAQLRNLYDGEAYKESGAGASKHYDNLRVTLLACSTHAIDARILVHQDLGTRELIYRTDLEKEDMDHKANKALANEGKEDEMREEIRSIVHPFLSQIEVKDIDIPEEDNLWLLERAKWLSIMRSQVSCDSQTGEVLGDVYPEVPTRLIKQLKRFYIVLKNLDENYDTVRAKRIINKIVKSSAQDIRVRVFDYLKHLPENDKEKTCSEISESIKIGKRTVNSQLNILWNLGLVSRNCIRTEQFGREMEINRWFVLGETTSDVQEELFGNKKP